MKNVEKMDYIFRVNAHLLVSKVETGKNRNLIPSSSLNIFGDIIIKSYT